MYWCFQCDYTVCTACLAPPRRRQQCDRESPSPSLAESSSAKAHGGEGSGKAVRRAASPSAPRQSSELPAEVKKGFAPRSGKKNKFDFSSTKAPECINCRRRAWPGLCSKAGKFHCAAPSCRNDHGAGFIPECHVCTTRTWGGQWGGVNMIAQGKGFFRRDCWVSESPDSE